MQFTLAEAELILARTPATLTTLLQGLPESFTGANEGPATWSARQVLGHLIHGEKTDWIPRAERIIQTGEGAEPPVFEPFDRFAQDREPPQPLESLLAELGRLRATNLMRLRQWKLSARDLERTGVHPEFGMVTLRQLLATWVVHDLGHLRQVARVLAKQYRDEVGPWLAYLRVLQEESG